MYDHEIEEWWWRCIEHIAGQVNIIQVQVGTISDAELVGQLIKATRLRNEAQQQVSGDNE